MTTIKKVVIDELHAQIGIDYTPVRICSDLHLWHKKILEYDTIRWEKFKDLDEHDDYIINEINKNVRENDILIMLWDLALCNSDVATEKLSRIICKHKYWILWNHDQKSLVNKSYHLWAWVCKRMILLESYVFQHHPPTKEFLDELNNHVCVYHWHTHRPWKYFWSRWQKIYDLSYDWTKLLYKLKTVDLDLKEKHDIESVTEVRWINQPQMAMVETNRDRIYNDPQFYAVPASLRETSPNTIEDSAREVVDQYVVDVSQQNINQFIDRHWI